MKCPECMRDGNNVIRTDKFDTVIVRVRKCRKCGYAWNTTETNDLPPKGLFLYGEPVKNN